MRFSLKFFSSTIFNDIQGGPKNCYTYSTMIKSGTGLIHLWTLDVSRTASYEITPVCLFVCLSVWFWLRFLKIWSLFFPDIVQDDGWPWYLVTDSQIFLKIWQLEFGSTGPKPGLKLCFFCYFLKFGLLVFLELHTMIACKNV